MRNRGDEAVPENCPKGKPDLFFYRDHSRVVSSTERTCANECTLKKTTTPVMKSQGSLLARGIPAVERGSFPLSSRNGDRDLQNRIRNSPSGEFSPQCNSPCECTDQETNNESLLLSQVTKARRYRSGPSYLRGLDDSKSLDSDGSVDDGFSPLDGDEGISVSRSTPSRRHSRQLPGQIGSLNVREMASFLEKTDSFIRRIDSGGESTQSRSKVANEVPSRPFKSRQAFDLGSWSSGYSVDQYTHGDDMVLRMEQSVELQRENFRLRDRLLEMQGRLERSEKEVLRLRDVIKQLKHGSSVDLSDSEEGSSTVLSPQQFVYSPSVLSELLMNMGFEENMAKQVTVQIELEYQR